MTRDDYNDWMASILKHMKNLQSKEKRKKSKTNLRRSGRTYEKHDKLSTRSSRNKPQIAKATTKIKESPSKEIKEEKDDFWIESNPTRETVEVYRCFEWQTNERYSNTFVFDVFREAFFLKIKGETGLFLH